MNVSTVAFKQLIIINFVKVKPDLRTIEHLDDDQLGPCGRTRLRCKPQQDHSQPERTSQGDPQTLDR